MRWLIISLLLLGLGGVVVSTLFDETTSDAISSGEQGKPMRVGVSLFPLMTLIRALTGEHAELKLLVDAALDPHDFKLSLKQARTLTDVDVLFYISDDFEYFLADLDHASFPAKRVQLSQVPGMTLLPLRTQLSDDQSTQESTSDSPDAHSDDVHSDDAHSDHAAEDHAQHAEDHAHHSGQGIDYHVWLDPVRAGLMAQTIADVLIELYPTHQAMLQTNVETLLNDINALHQRMQKTLSQKSAMRYLVYHDAFQYLEQRYGLQPVGVLAGKPHQPLLLSRAQTAIKLIKDGKVDCLFLDPKTSSTRTESLFSDHPIRQIMLDPLGSQIADEQTSYIDIMTALHQNMMLCSAKTR